MVDSIFEEASGLKYETLEDLANRTKLKKSWWYTQARRRDKGRPPFIKAGRYLLAVPKEIDKWLRDQSKGQGERESECVAG